MRTVIGCFLFAFFTGVWLMSCKTTGELVAMPKPLRRDTTPTVRIPRVKSAAEIQFLQQIQDLVASTPQDMKDIKGSLAQISDASRLNAESMAILIKNNDITLSRARDLRDAFEAYRLETNLKTDSLRLEIRDSEIKKAEAQQETVKWQHAMTSTISLLFSIIKFGLVFIVLTQFAIFIIKFTKRRVIAD